MEPFIDAKQQMIDLTLSHRVKANIKKVQFQVDELN